jgi:hypothetical protein
MRQIPGILEGMVIRTIKSRGRSFPLGVDYSDAYVCFLKKANKSVKIITRNLEPDFFNQEKIIEAIEFVLRKGCVVTILFHKHINKKNADDFLCNENPEWVVLKEKFPAQFRFIWDNSIPRKCYSVVDDESLVIETIIWDENKDTFVDGTCFASSKLVAEEWGNTFDRWIDKNILEIKKTFTRNFAIALGF